MKNPAMKRRFIMELLTSKPKYAIIPTDKEQGRDQYDSTPNS